MQKENLAAAIQLPLDGITNYALIVRRGNRLHRQAVVWRCLDGAHVPRAGEGEVERAGNRRGAKRQHIHHRAQAFEFFFVQHAEALLFINHYKSKVFESDVILNDAMRADNDVHRARRELLDNFRLLALGAETRKQFHAHRIIRHALAEIIVVLLREHGGRHEDGDLLAIHHRLERRADRYFGFAEANVTADQAVHRLCAFLVSLCSGDGGHLIRRFLVDESALELALPLRVRLARMARLRFAHGLDAEHFRRDVAHRFLGLLFRPGPAIAAKLIQRRVRFTCADVFADEMRLADGNVKFRRLHRIATWGVFQNQTLRF